MKEEVEKWTKKKNWTLIEDFHFGGYAKWDESLIQFINDFRAQTNIPLDPIYTGKLFYGVVKQVKQNKLTPDELLIIHSGGLQGIAGFNKRFGPLIET